MRKAFLVRLVAGILGCVLFSWLSMEPVQELWAHLGAWTEPNSVYRHFPHKRGYHHGYYTTYPRTAVNRHPKVYNAIAVHCTYLHVAALVFPFLVTRLRVFAVARAAIAALLLAWSINFIRFVVLNWLLRRDFTWFVAHDLTNAIATCLAVVIALAFFVRHQRRLRSVRDIPDDAPAENPASVVA